MRQKIPLLLALVLSVAAVLVPEKAGATCDPQGTRYFKTSFGDYNVWACDASGHQQAGNPCGPPPEQNWCFLGEYNPPTTCCNGYHEETAPQEECTCVYCRDVEFVCD